MIEEKYPSAREHEESKVAAMADERRAYSAQAVEEQRAYEQRGIGLVEGTELLMKHTDGYALSQDEYDALYEDQAQHTKKLFEDLKRLQSRRQRTIGRGGSASSSSRSGKQRKARKRPPNVQVRTSAAPPSASTRRTQTPVSKYSNRAKNRHSDASRSLPKTPRSSALDNDANTTRFRGAAATSASTRATSREHEHQHSQPIHSSRPGSAHRESKVNSADSSASPYLEDPQYSTKRPNVAPLKPAHVNQRHGTQQSTEAAHGAQYKRHAHMLQSQQMSTDHHHHAAGDAFQPSDTGSTGQATPRRRSGRGNRHGGRRPSSRNGRDDRRRTAEHRHATGSAQNHAGPAVGDGDEEESSGSGGSGAGMFPPDPLGDDVEQHPNQEPRNDEYVDHQPKAGKRSSRHARASVAENSTAAPTRASRSATTSATSSTALTAPLRQDPEHKSKPKKPKPPSQKKSDMHQESRPSTQGDPAKDDTAPYVNSGMVQPAPQIGGADVKEITAILRTVQGSISELSTKMGECTEAIRSLTEDRRRVKQKDATADLHTGEIIQQSINALSRNVQECSRAVHGLASNVIVTAVSNGDSTLAGAAGSKGHNVAQTNTGAGDENVAQGRQLLLHSPPPDAAFIMKKLTSMQEEIRAGMLKMQQHLTSRIDSTFADWLVEGTAATETSASGSASPAGEAATQDRRISSVQMLRQQTTQARQ